MLKITRKIVDLFTDEDDFRPNEYKESLIESHKENKQFNDKVISAASIAAVPFWVNFSQNLYLSKSCIYWLFMISISLFLIVFVYQLLNNLIALKACDKGIVKKYEDSNKDFGYTDKNEIIINVLFLSAIITSFSMFVVNTNMQLSNKENKAVNVCCQEVFRDNKYKKTESYSDKKLKIEESPKTFQKFNKQKSKQIKNKKEK